MLEETGLKFRIAEIGEVDENYPRSLPAEEVAGYLSQKKSHAFVGEIGSNEVLLTADTVVTLDNTVLGKPASEEEAAEMLGMLSGRTHTVITAMTLRTVQSEETINVSTQVTFNPLSAEMIEHYIARCSPMDKAGSYGIQEWIGLVAISRIEGSYHNVVGLPTARLVEWLQGEAAQGGD